MVNNWLVQNGIWWVYWYLSIYFAPIVFKLVFKQNKKSPFNNVNENPIEWCNLSILLSIEASNWSSTSVRCYTWIANEIEIVLELQKVSRRSYQFGLWKCFHLFMVFIFFINFTATIRINSMNANYFDNYSTIYLHKYS